MKNSGRFFQKSRKENSSKDFILSTFKRDDANESSIRTASLFVQRQETPSAFVMTRAQAKKEREQNEILKGNQPSTSKANPPDSQVETSPNQPEPKITWNNILPSTYEIPSFEERLEIIKREQRKCPETNAKILALQKGKSLKRYSLKQGVLLVKHNHCLLYTSDAADE